MNSSTGINKSKFNARYIAILLTCCGMMSSSIGLCMNSYGVFYAPISEMLGVGQGDVALHATLMGIVAGLVGPFVIKLLKTVHVRKIVSVGVITTCASFVLMAFATELWVFNVLGIMRGIGIGTFMAPVITSVMGNWFKKSQGLIIGLTMSFSGIAGAILSPFLNAIIENFGFQAASIASAIIIGLLVLPGSLFVLELSPYDIGQIPYGISAVAPTSTEGQEVKKPARLVNTLKYNSPVFLYLIVACALASAASGLTSHLPGIAAKAGQSAAVGATLISAAMIGNIFFKFLAGALTDKIGAFKAFSLMIITGCFSFLILLVGGGNLLIMYTGAFLYGSLYSVGAVGAAVAVRHVYGDKQYGTGFSVIAALLSIAPSVAISLIGFVYDATGTYSAILSGGIVVGLLALTTWWTAGLKAETARDMLDE